MNFSLQAFSASTLIVLLAACGGGAEESSSPEAPGEIDSGSEAAAEPEEDHAHDEVPLGTTTIGAFAVELKQAHEAVVAGKESHLVVKLPYNDQGSTVVRAWLGTSDRTQSYVGKGEYAADHDDYDIHATAPDPLPADVMWWIEIENPDGDAVVGSIAPILE